MHANCNHVADSTVTEGDTDCTFHLFNVSAQMVGDLARTHEADTGHLVTLYRDDTTVPRTEWATARAEWELSGADALLLGFEVAERLAGLVEVASIHGDADRARDLVAVLLNGLTTYTNIIATADPRRYADVARLAGLRVDRALAEVAAAAPSPGLRSVLRERVIAA